MNRILVLIIGILLPITFVTKKEEVPVYKGVTLENYALKILPKEETEEEVIKDEPVQVLISNNKDKSNPFKIDLEEYVIGVVAGEMPASFQEEALKAQAVAARTYALYKSQNNGYVLSTTVSDQVYLGEEALRQRWGSDYEFYYNKIKQAVNETKGEVVTYDDKIISAYYFAISNGYTEDAKTVFNEDKPYLVSVESNWDKNYQSYTSTRTISKASFCSKLNISCEGLNISNIVRSNNNYVREITINNETFSGLQIFNKLGLKSTDFKIEVASDKVVITTYGFGHSVGMSQYGAQGMAQEGYSYKDILSHYYKNTEVKLFQV